MFLLSPETIQIQAIQLKKAVEIPSSGSARVKEDEMAMIEMAVANKNGRSFFILINFNVSKKSVSKIKPVCLQGYISLSIFLFPDISTKKVRFSVLKSVAFQLTCQDIMVFLIG